ncbi:SMP-30/gluconolactonase/LRE family protein [Streptomyces caatingaensis]|uniref:Strictosidine synthase n=1 Tax=Streptomyces caatingaensis TaxID=1678637 RepID=A0A0K9XD10_9ACTN|nr:SMP-30/gluconolactonase/LRE family protein [Streptomyces caatingaensis]KNB50537.1 strictosidine synthase [Streptomyces caatingaensis]
MPPVRRLSLGGGTGPEDVRVDAGGRVLTGVSDGRVLALNPSGGPPRTLADTGGRPLGLCPLPDGGLLVCDAERGLLRVESESGRVHPLLREVAGRPLQLCSNAAAAPDGTLYVTDSSGRFPLRHWMGDLLEHSGTGRLVRCAPDGGDAEVLLDGLHFANGVTLAPDASFLVVAETGAYRLRRLWLTGPRAGRDDIFADGLPGFPDNLSTGPTGLVWTALAAPRSLALDLLHRTHPALRRALWSLPASLHPDPSPTAWAMAFDASGRPVHDLQRPGRDFRMVTSVCEHEGRLYLGSLTEDAVGAVPLPPAARP